MGNTKLSGLFLLWLGAAISIAEIVTGTLLAPLGWTMGITAIILGHLIGCVLFLFPAGYISARQSKSAIEVTDTAFGHWGVTLFSLLNAIQLLGWTAVMIVNAQIAMNAISQRLFHFHSPVVMAVIVAALIVLWLVLDHNWLFRVNNLIVILLAIGAVILIFTVMTSTYHAHATILSPLGFGAAVELNVTMALSWLPLIGDYTQKTQAPVKASFVSISGYFIGSCVMFLIGLSSVLITKSTDFTTVLAHSSLGLVALLIIVFSTVTTTFMDAYSAATNIANITQVHRIKLLGVIITIIGLIIALMVSLSAYQSFLYTIGAVFTPLFSIVFTTYFILPHRLPIIVNFGWWLVGIFLYNHIQQFNFWCGPTVITLLSLIIGLVLSYGLYRQLKK